MRLRDLALRNRLLLLLLGPMLLLLAVSLFGDYQTALQPSNDAYDHALGDAAVAVASRLSWRDGHEQLDMPASAVAMLVTDRHDRIFFTVRGPDGDRLAGNADLLAAPDPTANPHFSDGMVGKDKVRVATYLTPTPVGPVTVVVAETLAKREHAASRIAAGLVVPNLLLVVATLLIVYFGVRTALKPLDRLGQEIAQRSPHDTHALPEQDVPLEARPLVRAINGLIADLRGAAAAQQAFLANAAHQLRTPLAGLQTQLELAAEDLPPDQRQRIDKVRDATRRLGHLAHQLLSLARSAPEATLAQEHEPIELGHLLEDIAPQFLDAAIARSLDLGFEPMGARVEGSRWLLRELFSNLIDNAIRYTPAGGRITVRSGTAPDGSGYLEVEDSGPGIPEAERGRIFERFYRVPGTVGTGSGLGLAIVREVADRHGATVVLAGPDGGRGTRVRVNFPRP